jgi:hypothetical protein
MGLRMFRQPCFHVSAKRLIQLAVHIGSQQFDGELIAG